MPLTPNKPHTTISLEILQARNQKEFFNENLRIEDGNVSGSTNDGVGSGRQGVEHIISNQLAGRGLNDGCQDVVYHLVVNFTCARTMPKSACCLPCHSKLYLYSISNEVWMLFICATTIMPSQDVVHHLTLNSTCTA